jgi:predicted metalloprotease
VKWRGGRSSGGVEDRRGLGGGTIAAGGGGVAIIVAIAAYFLGIDPNAANQIVNQLGGGSIQREGTFGTPGDPEGKFVDIIATNLNDVWAAKIGQGYEGPAAVVIYTGGTGTGCGYGQAAMGPFYCPSDRKVYLDLAFWQDLDRLGAGNTDPARAYVLAHEFGHHVQVLTGASERVQRAQQAARNQADGNRYSVALELQADCYAGVWAKSAASVSNGEVAFEPGDIEKGLQAANAIGDDTLQRSAGRGVSPENFTHGSSAQRVEWLRRGYESGDPRVCEGTFEGL